MSHNTMHDSKKYSKHITLRLCVTLLMLGCIIVGAVLPVAAASYPKASDNVADEAGVLSESTIRTIKSNNESLKGDVGAAIAVCVVKTTGDTDIAEYAHSLFKEWKLGEGILLLIASEDENYYFVQSVGVEKIITNETLLTVRDKYLEEDFAAGNIDRGVSKTVNRLSALLVSSLENAAVEEDDASGENSGEKGTTVGSVIVGFFKVLLWIVIIAVILFAVLFVAALFNDDAAEIFSYFWQNVILRKGKSKAYSMPDDYYDERLYGNRSAQKNTNSRRRPDRNQNRRPANQQINQPNRQSNRQPNRQPVQQNNQLRQQNYPALQDGRQRNIPQNQTRQQTYYNADGTPRQPRQNPNTQYGSNGYNMNQQFGDETRQFTIPTREQNRR